MSYSYSGNIYLFIRYSLCIGADDHHDHVIGESEYGLDDYAVYIIRASPLATGHNGADAHQLHQHFGVQLAPSVLSTAVILYGTSLPGRCTSTVDIFALLLDSSRFPCSHTVPAGQRLPIPRNNSEC